MQKLIYSFMIWWLFSSVAFAQIQTTPATPAPEETYQKAGEEDAAVLRKNFEKAEKPKYQKAYDDYLKDLKLINIFGQARDNQALYDDLGAMNSNEKIIYSRNKPDKRPIYKPVY